MPHVHPTAVISGDVLLAEDAVVGPYSVLAGRIRVGPGTTLVSHVHLHGPAWIGAGNTFYPGVCIGFAPQDLKFDPSKEGAGVVIGDGNVFREHVTIHRATRDDRPTTVGHRNYWMANAHAGHDVQVGNDCIFANGTLFAGHASIGDRVITGGNATVHQFTRIGRLCMIGGLMGTNLDLCPFFVLGGINLASAVNAIGLRRAGVSREAIDHIRWAFRIVARSALPRKRVLEELRSRESVPEVREIAEFLVAGTRGFATGRGRPEIYPRAAATGAPSEPDWS